MKEYESMGERAMKLRTESLLRTLAVLMAAAIAAVPSAALAQQTPEGTDKGAQIMLDTWVQTMGANALGDAYDGDSRLNQGYKATPIMFDYDLRKYPKLRNQANGQMIDSVPNLEQIVPGGEYTTNDTRSNVKSLSTDDEISRVTMAVYQPLENIKVGVAENVNKRDRYLDLFKTIRGVANLTLSYLDKTVAAGLATTESQVNQETENMLLKQISWTSSRLANPQRSQIYVDADEKMQSCLNSATEGPVMGQGRFTDFTSQACSQECGQMPTDVKLRYGYCLCCVQQTAHATISTGVQGTQSTPATKWSLVDRYFSGVKAVQSGNGGQEVLDFAQFIKEMYGDVVVDKNGYHFVFPEFSVSDKVRALRDGCMCTTSCQPPQQGQKSQGQPCSPPHKPYGGGGGSVIACPFTGMATSYGIKLGMLHVLRMKDAPWDTMTTHEKRTWVEASTGTLITPAIKKSALMLHDGTEEPLGCSEQPTGKLARWLQNFSDASAVSAFEKLHYRTKVLLTNHDVLNLRMTPNDRRMFWTMVDRVDRFIQMAKADTSSDRAAVQAVTDAVIARDRRKQADMAAAVAANIASQNMAEAVAGTSRFGDFTDICTGTVC